MNCNKRNALIWKRGQDWTNSLNFLEIGDHSAELPQHSSSTSEITARELSPELFSLLERYRLRLAVRGQTCIWNKTKVKLWQKQLPNKNFEPLRIKLLGRVLLCNQGYFSALNFVPNFTFTCFCNLSISPIRMDSFNCFVDCDESLDCVEIFGN